MSYALKELVRVCSVCEHVKVWFVNQHPHSDYCQYPNVMPTVPGLGMRLWPTYLYDSTALDEIIESNDPSPRAIKLPDKQVIKVV